ncbi:cytochrome P450/oxidoreductase [Halomonas chromatireducens]|uniref:Cytochrome P450 116 n=1 Tax=Halomonas chromatireducens TaxID=507626 RepID=A0A109UL69_9GAMM|nr:cytochrome P450/oxidoreductase [Halomonas chromatireducens]AMD00068.1 Cytochrome P450 116 [Halomonas chromatireducens]
MTTNSRRAGAEAGGCPIHQPGRQQDLAPNGCPISPRAAAFDPFDRPYQLDPAEALRWSREQEPVFYSPRLGYWVVSRYDDIKAIFRDNITFSPSIALEKITPASKEAQAVLERYDYGMNRTLVNEDEPAHMARRRELLEAFSPEALEAHAPMVRRLVREKLDAIVDRGRADLVDEMFWEVPLTVALHFLGVPEEDMEQLRRFSVAHTLNTWGRPSPEQQVEVAEGVGKFWQYSGEVLVKMQRQTRGKGWMYDMIEKNRQKPDVVTDNYLHSMMMAIIVAAHETTALATANAFRQLLSRPAVWDELCDNPELIPAAAEECLRHSGSVVAWRRRATREVAVGGVTIPEDGKILMVTASGNHDPSHFENPDELDIYRDNAVDHLTFGYGSHQCMGKNLGRMEMRIFLEEFTRRLPHLELEEQEFTFLPNTSFRGPEALWVRWDPAKNPERQDPAVRTAQRDFAVGAPSRQDIARTMVVAKVQAAADGVLQIALEDPRGRRVPAWSPGSHVDLIMGDYVRKYSLCGETDDPYWLQVAVLREEAGRGGSAWIHEHFEPGMTLRLRGPKNHFRLDESAQHYVLIAGGIGITPIIAMADRLRRLGKSYELHYAGRSRSSMAFIERLERDHGEALQLYPKDEGRRLDLAGLLAEPREATLLYACGPERLLTALEGGTAHWPEGSLHVEHFTAEGALLDPENEHAFEVELTDSELTVEVPPERTLLQVLRTAGIDVPSDCEEGLCGSCQVEVVEGEVDHRDKVLTAAERASQDRLMSCCSRARGRKLVLAL